MCDVLAGEHVGALGVRIVCDQQPGVEPPVPVQRI
eukprot:COSAG02_NODE_20102_length_848_cov_1.385848_1_plen_34_part_10